MRRAWLLVGAAVTVWSCAAVTGLSDYVITSEDTPSEDGAAPVDGASAPDATSSSSGGGADAGAADATLPRPTYCDGISVYASYDTTLDTSQRDPATNVTRTTLVLDAGLNGGAAELTGVASAYYSIADAAPPRWTETAGTVALWIKQRRTLAATADGTIARFTETAPPGGGGGPAISRAPNQLRFGMETNPVAVLGSAKWRDLEWNHVAGTWVKTPGGFTLTLNGGGTEGARAEVSGEWAPPEVANFVRIGSAAAPMDALVDDFTWWTRALSAAEIAALVADGRGGRSIAVACGLR